MNIYDLGLIYSMKAGTGGEVEIKMTLTSPRCPVAESASSGSRGESAPSRG